MASNGVNPDNRTDKRKLGDIGENIACDFLKRRGFEIVERNYLRKWGEIDIVAQKGNVMRFVEVKSVSCVTLVGEPGSLLGRHLSNDSYVTSDRGYRPEDNVHPAKLGRLARAIQTYLLERRIESDWQLDVITVKISQSARKARVELIENVII